MRSQLKRSVEVLLVRGGAAWVARRFGAGRDLILAYHNILPDDVPIAGDRSLHLPRRQFAEQLDLLMKMYDIVPLEQLLDVQGQRRRPRIAISFDDAYNGAVTIGVGELVSRELPATMFVAPAMLGGRSFWWDAFADPPPGGLPNELRRMALRELRGQDGVVREWAARNGRSEQPLGSHYKSATLDELEAAAEYSHLSLASHTWSHPNLAMLRIAELGDELEKPLHWLRERFDSVIDWLSYPYGLASADVESAALAAGYAAAVRIDGGRLAAQPANRFALPRINVPSQLTANGLALRVVGLVS